MAAALLFLLAGPAGAAEPEAPAAGPGAPAAPPAAERTLIAVLNLEPAGASDVEVSALSDRLREELLRTGKFSLVERERLDAVLEEQQLQQVACTGKDCALQVGRVLGVQQIVTGRAVKLGPDSWQVSAQLIDVQTAETERAESVIHEGRMVDLLRQGIPELAARLAGEAPAPPAAAAQTPPPEPKTPEPEKKTEPPSAPMEPTPSVRLYVSPVSSFAMNLMLSSSTGDDVTETFGGVGISLGADFFLSREFALWLATHVGVITSWSATSGGSTVTLENVSGDYATVAGGADLVLGGGPWRFLLGGGLFNTATTFQGTIPNTGTTVDSDANVFGVIFDIRGDYTFESGWWAGLGLQAGFGGASGTETQGASSATANVAHVFIPIGYSF